MRRKEMAKVVVDADTCVGCGLCAHFCPENAISMIEKPRIVRVPPYKYMH